VQCIIVYYLPRVSDTVNNLSQYYDDIIHTPVVLLCGKILCLLDFFL